MKGTDFGNRAARRLRVREVNRIARRYGVRTIDFGTVSNRAVPTLPGQATPDTAENLEDYLSDPVNLRDPEAWRGKLRDYIALSRRTDPGVLAQVREQTEQVMTAWLREQQENGATPVDLSTGRGMRVGASRGAGYDPAAPAAALDAEFENTSDFLRFTWDKNPDPANAERIRRIRNEFSSLSPADGGFLIPERLRAELLRVALETAIVRSRARVIPMDSLRVPFPTLDSTSNASSVHGGIVAYWTAEGAQMTESAPKFGRVVLEANKLTAYADMPAELLQDSIISLAAFVEEVFPEAIVWFEDIAFLSGNGVGQPLGMLTAGNTAMITQNKATGQSADTIVWENIIGMYARMLPTSLARAVWLVPPDAFPELATMALEVGTGGSAVWLNNGASGPPATILGRPVIITEKVAKLGDARDISLVDMSYYLIGDRREMRAESTTVFRFNTDEVSYRVIERVDGRPWIRTAITPKNGGNTLSPFVTLAERA